MVTMAMTVLSLGTERLLRTRVSGDVRRYPHVPVGGSSLQPGPRGLGSAREGG